MEMEEFSGRVKRNRRAELSEVARRIRVVFLICLWGKYRWSNQKGEHDINMSKKKARKILNFFRPVLFVALSLVRS